MAKYINKACQAQEVLAKLQQYKQLWLLIPNQQHWKNRKAGTKPHEGELQMKRKKSS
jgi:hypothetical protein